MVSEMAGEKDIREELGLVHVYTGNGKGKTTAALGLALRAMGNDLEVAMVQFMKCDQYYGEYQISKELPHLTLLPMGRSCLVHEDKVNQADIDAAGAALAKAKELLMTTSLSVTDIAMKAGFNDANYFSRQFTAETGLPPRIWRAADHGPVHRPAISGKNADRETAPHETSSAPSAEVLPAHDPGH